MLATKNDIAEHYKLTLKEAMCLYTNGAGSLEYICKMMNDKYNLPEGGKRLNRMTLMNYCKLECELVDTSPPSASLPPVLLELIDANIPMSQLSGNEECKPRKVKGLIGAAIANTEYYRKFSVLYVHRKLRKRFADTIKESKVTNAEDCCMNLRNNIIRIPIILKLPKLKIIHVAGRKHLILQDPYTRNIVVCV